MKLNDDGEGDNDKRLFRDHLKGAIPSVIRRRARKQILVKDRSTRPTWSKTVIPSDNSPAAWRHPGAAAAASSSAARAGWCRHNFAEFAGTRGCSCRRPRFQPVSVHCCGR